jgi:hypothetical protein
MNLDLNAISELSGPTVAQNAVTVSSYCNIFPCYIEYSIFNQIPVSSECLWTSIHRSQNAEFAENASCPAIKIYCLTLQQHFRRHLSAAPSRRTNGHLITHVAEQTSAIILSLDRLPTDQDQGILNRYSTGLHLSIDGGQTDNGWKNILFTYNVWTSVPRQACSYNGIIIML